VLAQTSGREHRSVHISQNFDRNKGEHGFDRSDLRFLYYTKKSREYKSSTLSIIIFIFITPI
jgi:hypothetical protein